MGGPPALGLAGGRTTPHRKKKSMLMKCYTLDSIFGTKLAMESGHGK